MRLKLAMKEFVVVQSEHTFFLLVNTLRNGNHWWKNRPSFWLFVWIKEWRLSSKDFQPLNLDSVTPTPPLCLIQTSCASERLACCPLSSRSSVQTDSPSIQDRGRLARAVCPHTSPVRRTLHTAVNLSREVSPCECETSIFRWMWDRGSFSLWLFSPIWVRVRREIRKPWRRVLRTK